VCGGHEFDGPTESFDVVISCEVMEHNPYWKETLQNMIRLLKPGGLLIMSCATTGRREHGTSHTDSSSSPLTVDLGWDYYRNLRAKDVIREVDLSQLSNWGFVTNLEAWDLYMLGVKAGGKVDNAARIARFKSIYRKKILPSLAHRLVFSFRHPARVKSFLTRILLRRLPAASRANSLWFK
ncbi:MAG TPA: methyltransferase domain-containing protein, partial [Terriglobia bacterium]|nr:methyltransferase domain-containing protein [Terriglobia bacterium]